LSWKGKLTVVLSHYERTERKKQNLLCAIIAKNNKKTVMA